MFRNLRRMLGLDRLRQGTSGAAPISPDLLMWYRAIGVPLLEGYGMTENAGSGHGEYRRGQPPRLGGPRRARRADCASRDDGEIQTYGLNNFMGYWRNNEKTAETYTDDGWLRTGDVGRLDNDGFLTITAASRTSSSRRAARTSPRPRSRAG